jgi:disease resistance protein RPM1
VRVPRGIGNLKELEIVEVVDINRTSRKTVKELGGLVQLKKLRVCLVACVTRERLSHLSQAVLDILVI